MKTFIKFLAKRMRVNFGFVLGLMVAVGIFAGISAHQAVQLKEARSQLSDAQVVNQTLRQQAKSPIKIPEDGKRHVVRTNLFEIEVYNYDGANFDATITPYLGRVIGEQGVGAKGLELYSTNSSCGAQTVLINK